LKLVGAMVPPSNKP